jgi:hypothetical protein
MSPCPCDFPRGGCPVVSLFNSSLPSFYFIIRRAAFALEPSYEARIDLSMGVLNAVDVLFALIKIDAARGLWIWRPVLPADPRLA